jgi:hypothetical protein
LYSLFRARKSCGRSCHGLPFRAIHSTASTDSRLSAAVRPGSGILPGSNDTIRPYCTSLSINLDILFLRKRQDVDRFLRKLPPLFFTMIVSRPLIKFTSAAGATLRTGRPAQQVWGVTRWAAAANGFAHCRDSRPAEWPFITGPIAHPTSIEVSAL